MHAESSPSQSQPPPATEPVEARSARLRRHGHRAGLYTWAFGLVALLVVLIALVIANTRQVKLSWVFGSGHASLVWIILAAAVLGWLLGIVTGIVFRMRTRRRHTT
ncbi:MAG TPA: lipopolysaccharide assembly protein LapA domain-containing protein [Gaiellaceae bacterium]